MYLSAEFITLAGKEVGGITVHPIVDIRLMGGEAGGMVQVVPVALVLEGPDGVLTFLMEQIRISMSNWQDNVV
ncbi:MAG: hypothetical protein ACOX2G_12545 [Bacillota bacterium]